ncbi:hypothetical protein [Brevundimonas sp.]|uniref:hypothetical protein n=1 Tax=Brevundimonas sp. TaxID=1871086 RepID=UPI002737EED6|nr:hypothetical protein [Brevundimonas sp.]MDP3803637.1 hypothetical protein [Brevundimonas sp.]
MIFSALMMSGALIAQDTPVAPLEPLRQVFVSPQAVGYIGEPRPLGDGRIQAWGWVFLKDTQSDGTTNGLTMLNEVDCGANVSRVVVYGKYFHTMHMGDVAGETTSSARQTGTPPASMLTGACNYARLQSPLLPGPEAARDAADQHFGR